MAARYGDHVVLKPSQGVGYIKPVVIEPTVDAECSTKSGGDTPELTSSPEMTDQSTNGNTPTGVAVAGAP